MPTYRSLEVLSEWSLVAVERAILEPVTLTLSPLYSTFHSGMSNLQTFLAERLRRVKYGDNRNNKAALLPPEIQLQIFHLLRTRARFRTAEFFVAASEDMPILQRRYPRASRDLAAARLACQAWFDSATEVLYTDVVLGTLRQFLAFADTLNAYPNLAGSVRRLALPVDLRRLHRMQSAQLDERVPYAGGASWRDVRATLDCLFAWCTDVEDVAFFGGQEAVRDMTVLFGHCSGLTHLASCNDHWAPTRSETFNITLATACRLRSLESLTLRSWAPEILHSVRVPALLTLRTLCLENCVLDKSVLPRLLSKLPNLRVFVWQGNFLDGLAWCELAATDLLAAHLRTLTSCTFHRLRHREYLFDISITLDNVDAFSALRTLSISGCMLQGLGRLPPSLAELEVVDFIPTGPGRHLLRAAVLEPADIVRCRAQLWRECSPALRHIRLWDRDIARGQLRIWGIVALLLRDFLTGLDVELEVDLTLNHVEEETYRSRFWRQEHLRGLLWKDML